MSQASPPNAAVSTTSAYPHGNLSVRAHLFILATLLVLTLLTIGVSFLPLAGDWHVAAGLAIAVVKAALVVLYFMHVIHHPRLVGAVIVIAVFWLLIMFSLTFSDYLTRDIVS